MKYLVERIKTYLGGGIGTAISGCIANLFAILAFIFKICFLPQELTQTVWSITQMSKKFFDELLLLIISEINSCHTVITVAME